MASLPSWVEVVDSTKTRLVVRTRLWHPSFALSLYRMHRSEGKDPIEAALRAAAGYARAALR